MLLNDCNIVRMELQTLLVRMDDAIDDLAQLLDLLHRLPARQREAHLERMQGLKNKLISLKNNLTHANAHSTEKQYKQVYLAMNTLRAEINAHCAKEKENQPLPRGKDYRAVKKNYEDAVRLIHQKDQEVSGANQLLNQKEELIKASYEELRDIQRESEAVKEENRLLKYEQTTLTIELEGARSAAARLEEDLLEARVREGEKDKAFQSAVQELERLRGELIKAKETISQHEQAQARASEENLKKKEYDLNESFKLREQSAFKKLREVKELESEISSCNDQIRLLESHNKRFKEDIQVLENELKRGKRATEDQKQAFSEEKEKLYLEIKRARAEIEAHREVIEQGEKKNGSLLSRLSAAEEVKVELAEVQGRLEVMVERNRQLEGALDQKEREVKGVKREREKAYDQNEKVADVARELEKETLKLKEKMKFKEEERLKLIHEIELFERKLKEAEKAAMLQDANNKDIERQLVQERASTLKLEQRYRAANKELESIKSRFIRAKIETIHQIRQTLK